MPFGVGRLDREVVQVADGAGLCDAVGQHVLPVGDLRRAAKTGVQALPGDGEQELVTAGHGFEQDAKLEVGGQVGLVAWQRGAGVEIAVGVHQVDLHTAPTERLAMRSFSCGYVSRYLRAMASA